VEKKLRSLSLHNGPASLLPFDRQLTAATQTGQEIGEEDLGKMKKWDTKAQVFRYLSDA